MSEVEGLKDSQMGGAGWCWVVDGLLGGWNLQSGWEEHVLAISKM